MRGRLVSGLSLVLLIGAALIAAPTGVAGKPIRTVFPSRDPFVIPAGLGCPFAVGFVPIGHHAITEFDDGHITTIANGDITITNLDTGRSYLQHSNFYSTETYPDADTAVDVGHGKFVVDFFPGDQGPFGVVGENGALFAFKGTASTTVDLNTFAFTSFSSQGTMIDICAALAG